MKKVISAGLSAVMCVGAVLSVLTLPAGARLYQRGDANRDGIVNAMDLNYLKQHCTGGEVDIDAIAADCSGDGKVNTTDIFYIKQNAVGAIVLADLEDGFGWEGFKIAGQSLEGYSIVVTNPSNANMVFAAEELKKYVQIGDGTELAVTEVEPEEKKIVLSEDTTGEMGNDGFEIKVLGGNVYITAGAKRGTMYAVYEMLEDYWGYRFYGYGDYEILKEGITDIPNGTADRQIPQVLYRCNCIDPYDDQYMESSTLPRKLSGATSHPSMQKAKYGYGIERLWANAHSFDVFIPESETGKWPPCLSQESNFEICLNNMKKLIEQRMAAGARIGNEITEISCSYAADNKYCSCRYCRNVLKEEGAQSGILCRFANKIDDELQLAYPGITVVVNAYYIGRKPPKVTALNDDIILLYCWNACANHSIGGNDCDETAKIKDGDLGSNHVEKEQFLGWMEKCSRVYIWYYPTNIYYLLCPQPNFFKLYENFMWFAEHGVEGYYVVGTHGSSFESLDAYLTTHLMWDTDMTYEEYENHIREYLKYYYGYGWTYIWEYMEMLQEAGAEKGCVLNDYEYPFDIYSEQYFRDNFETMKTLVANAYGKARTADERDNIIRLAVHTVFLGLSATYERDYVNGDENSRAIFERTWSDLYDYINKNGIRTTHSSVGISTPFTIEVSPMELVYGISGSRH